jgi:hypothetical protein
MKINLDNNKPGVRLKNINNYTIWWKAQYKALHRTETAGRFYAMLGCG